MNVYPSWLLPDSQHLGAALVRIALTIVGAVIVQRLGFFAVWRAERWLERASHASEHGRLRARTLAQIARNLITTFVGGAALVHILELVGWDVKPLLVGASILGAALGFGAQYLVRDIIAGAFILVEDQFMVGDRVEINGQVATVEQLTLRSTRLRDGTGRMLFVPNGEMKIIVNHSRGWNLAIIDVPLATNQDLSPAFGAAELAVADINGDPDLRSRLIEPIKLMGFDQVGPEGAVMRLAGRALADGAADTVVREGRWRLLQRLRAAGLRTAASSELALFSNSKETALADPHP